MSYRKSLKILRKGRDIITVSDRKIMEASTGLARKRGPEQVVRCCQGKLVLNVHHFVGERVNI